MASLKIAEHADKAVKEISGGTKRKLCFAISLLGEPEVVLMDEPSTGMDPGSKRFLWDTITKVNAMIRGIMLEISSTN
jgi:ATP-binding cassette subfamily A (ABC1) protein 5